MNNIDRAAKIIDSLHTADQILMEGSVGYFDAPAAAQELADAGLLAPDLPEPKEIDYRAYRWNSTHTRAAYDIRSGAAEEVDAPGGVTVYADPESDSEIWVDVDHGEQLLTPDEAEALGLALLAAAQHAKGQA